MAAAALMEESPGLRTRALLRFENTWTDFGGVGGVQPTRLNLRITVGA
jgi:hypothetical protein